MGIIAQMGQFFMVAAPDITIVVTVTAVRNSVNQASFTVLGAVQDAATEDISFVTTIANANGDGDSANVPIQINNGANSGTNSITQTVEGDAATNNEAYNVTITALLSSPTVGYVFLIVTPTVNVPAFVDTSVFVTITGMRLSNNNVRYTYMGVLDHPPQQTVVVAITATNQNGMGSVSTNGFQIEASGTSGMGTFDVLDAISGAYTITFQVASVTPGFTAVLSTNSLDIPALSLIPVSITPAVTRASASLVTYTFNASVTTALTTSDILVQIMISNSNGIGRIRMTTVTIARNSITGTMSLFENTAISGSFIANLAIGTTTPTTHQGQLTATSLTVPANLIPITVTVTATRTSQLNVNFTVAGSLQSSQAVPVTGTTLLSNVDGANDTRSITLNFPAGTTTDSESISVSLDATPVGVGNLPFNVTVANDETMPTTVGYQQIFTVAVLMIPSF